MLNGDITPDDYKGMKNDIENLLNELRIKEILSKCGNVFKNASTENKQHIIGSIFPERFVLKKNKYQTPTLNRVVSPICTNNGQFKSKKKEKYIFNDVLSKGVVSPRIELGSKV